jgi:hypothetical protein
MPDATIHRSDFPRLKEPEDIHGVIPTVKLRMAKENVLKLANEIQAKHGKFKATYAGNPTLVYGQGHDMRKHGEGKALHPDDHHAQQANKHRYEHPEEYED